METRDSLWLPLGPSYLRGEDFTGPRTLCTRLPTSRSSVGTKQNDWLRIKLSKTPECIVPDYDGFLLEYSPLVNA